MQHPAFPQSNVAKFSSYHPEKYALDKVPITVRTDEVVRPGNPPSLTQRSVALYLRPLTRELSEVPPCPNISELPDTVINRMVYRDKAFWVDSPGKNAYNLHDAFDIYALNNDTIYPDPDRQAVFPRSYQYELACIKHRRQHACDGLMDDTAKKPASYCRKCGRTVRLPMPAHTQDESHKRWRYYPDLTKTLSPDEIRKGMDRIGLPFRNEACNWYYKNYPSEKFNLILRKFSG